MNNCENITLRGLGCEFISGFAFKSSDYSNKGVPLIKIGNIQNRIVKIDLNGNFISTENIEDKYERYFLNHNDVLIAMTGQGSVGRVGRLKLDDEIKPFLNQRVGKFICNETDLNIDFLYYVLSSKKYQEILFNIGSGSGQPNLSPNAILNVEIPKISYQIQKRIADVLSALDNKIEINNKINENLEAQAQAIFKQWFVDEAKEDWKEKPISYFGNVICGKTPSKNNKEYFGGEIPFIKIPDMHGNAFIINTSDTLTEAGKLSQENKTLPSYSICVSCIATVGLVSMNIIEAQTNQQINSIIPFKEEYRYYLYLKLSSMYEYLNSIARGGTATLNLNTTNFMNIIISIPNEDKLIAFHEVVSPIFKEILNNMEENKNLSEIRDSLLPKLMSGEIRV